MESDFPTTGDERSPGAVMAAIDDGRFLIADVGQDDAWLSTPHAAALDLDAHR